MLIWLCVVGSAALLAIGLATGTIALSYTALGVAVSGLTLWGVLFAWNRHAQHAKGFKDDEPNAEQNPNAISPRADHTNNDPVDEDVSDAIVTQPELSEVGLTDSTKSDGEGKDSVSPDAAPERVLAGPTHGHPPASANNSIANDAEYVQGSDGGRTVVVIVGRKRYHSLDCVIVSGHELEELTIEEAQEEGFTPCTTCSVRP